MSKTKMNFSTTLPYFYNSRKVKSILAQSKHDSARVLGNLLKILDDKEPIENFDFAANFPTILKFLNDFRGNKEYFEATLKMFQVALSNLNMKCRKIQSDIEVIKSKASVDEIVDFACDANEFIVDKEIANTGNKRSEVVIAHDKKKNYYAIKKFKYDIDSMESQQNLLKYIASYSKMKHKAILPFHGFNLYYRGGGRNVCPAIITDYQKKKSLQDVIQNTGAPIMFNDTQKTILIFGVASALRYIHKRDAYHGNLKPSNILLNSRFEPFVGDFFHNTLDSGDSNVINVKYMAPELYNNSVKSKELIQQQRADVYSFAMVSYSILTSLIPFGADVNTPSAVMKLVNSDKKPQFPSYVPQNIIDLLSRCWNNDPTLRPSFKEIIGILLSNNTALPETDMDAFGAYVKKVMPSRRAPTKKNTKQILARSGGRITLSFSQSDVVGSPGPDIKARVDFNNPASVFKLAMKLKNGDGIQENIPQYLKYLKKCVNAGYHKAQVEYGKALLEGVKTSDPVSPQELLAKNEEEATYFFQLAAEQGDIEAQYLYGNSLYYGIGIKQNYHKAVKYLETSAQKGNRDAQYLYGLCLKEGNGVPQNIPMAIKCFQIAMENGDISSMRHLAELGVDI